MSIDLSKHEERKQELKALKGDAVRLLERLRKLMAACEWETASSSMSIDDAESQLERAIEYLDSTRSDDIAR